jgi:ketosteroid isomerase-like protein
MTANEKAVADVLSAYNLALNSSDADAVMALHAEDGIFHATVQSLRYWLDRSA